MVELLKKLVKKNVNRKRLIRPIRRKTTDSKKPKVVFVCVGGSISKHVDIPLFKKFLRKHGLLDKVDIDWSGFERNIRDMTGADIVVSRYFDKQQLPQGTVLRLREIMSNNAKGAKMQLLYTPERGADLYSEKTYRKILTSLGIETKKKS